MLITILRVVAVCLNRASVGFCLLADLFLFTERLTELL